MSLGHRRIRKNGLLASAGVLMFAVMDAAAQASRQYWTAGKEEIVVS